MRASLGYLWVFAVTLASCSGGGGIAAGTGPGAPTPGVDTSPPVVRLESPTPGSTISEVTPIVVYASDPSGVESVTVYINGIPHEMMPLLTDFFVYNLDTNRLGNQILSLSVVARDTRGNGTTLSSPSVSASFIVAPPQTGGGGSAPANHPPSVLSVLYRNANAPGPFQVPSGPVQGTAPFSVQFQAQAFDPEDGVAISGYLWDFGNGNISSLPTPTATFAEGIFNVKVTVFDKEGLASPVSPPITLLVTGNTKPTVVLKASLTPDNYQARGITAKAPPSGLQVYFYADASDPDGGNVSCFWDFGNGTRLEGGPTQSTLYPPGSYTATVYVIDDEGSFSSVSSLSIQALLTRPPFVDAKASLDQVTWSKGPINAQPGQPVFFIATYNDPDGVVASTLWNFGNGNTATGGNPPAQVYLTPSTYTVTFQATDNDGLTTTEAIIVNVASPGGGGGGGGGGGANRPPVLNSANADAPSVEFKNGEATINFTASATDPDNDNLTYEWDFGDGARGTGATIAHKYTRVGPNYRVTVTVKDGRGGQASKQILVVVTDLPVLGRPPFWGPDGADGKLEGYQQGSNIGRMGPDDFLGKVLHINFWAQWCGPCRAEFPHMQDVFSRRGPEGYEIAAIACCDTQAANKAFADQYPQYTWKWFWDTPYDDERDTYTRYDSNFAQRNAIPQSYFVDRNGYLRIYRVGAFSDPASLEALIDKLLPFAN